MKTHNQPPIQTHRLDMKLPHTPKQKLLSLALGLALSALSPVANAASLTWDGADFTQNGFYGGLGTWASGTNNWTTDPGTGPTEAAWTDLTGATDTAVFAGSAGTVTISGSQGALGLIFNTAGYTLQSGTLNLGAGGIDASSLSSGTTTLSSAIILQGAQSWNIGNGSSLTASGAISGTSSLAKIGAGTLTLTAATNTFSGGLTISSGVLSVSSNTQLGGASGTAGAVALDGGTLKYTNTAALTNTHPLTITSNGGTLNILGSATASQNSRVIFGTSNQLLGSGSLTINGAGTLGTATGNNTRFGGAGALALGSGVTTTYSGNITLQNGGLIEYGATNALPSSATITLGNEAEIAMNSVATSNNNITVTGGSNSFLSFNGNGGTFAGNVALNANLIVGLRNWYNSAPTAASGNISGIISGTGNLTVSRDQATTGTPSLTLTGANTYTGTTTIAASSILQLGNGGATGSLSTSSPIVNNGTLTINRSGAVVQGTDFSGSPITGSGGFTQAGSGTTTLNAANTYTGQTSVNAGTLNYSGTLASAAQINVGTSGGGNAKLNVVSGASINMNNANVYIGAGTSATSGPGFVYQTGGTWNGGAQTAGGTGYSGFRLGGAGQGSYGYYNLSGGSLNVSELDVACGDNNFAGIGFGVLDMSGGTMNVGMSGTNGWLIASRATGSGNVGIVNLTGGTLTYSGPAAQFKSNWGTNGTAIFNISNAMLSAVNADIDLNQKNNSGNFGEFNLLTGGTLQAHSIASSATGTKYVNFNGGTLKASTATTTFITTNNTAVNVFGNGGTIDNNGVGITIPVALLAASGTGVSSVPVTNAGSGYLGAPAVTFSGGGGTGAAGYAVISSGTISSIVITNPGTGYTSAPAVTLTGGGGTGATVGTINLAANTSGGMTFRGSGTTTLNGASTYNGGTIVNGSMIALGASSTGAGNSVTNGPLGTGTVTLQGTAGLQLNNKTLGNNLVVSSGANSIFDNATGDSNLNGNVSGSGTITIQNTSPTINLSVHVGNGVASDWSGFTGTLNYSTSAGSQKIVNIFAPTASVFDLSNATVNFSNSANNVNSSLITTAGQATKLGSLSGFGYISNSGTVEVGNLNTTTTFTGVISGSGALTKVGTGSLTLSASNSYTGGTTINSGTLVLSNSLSSSGTVNVNGGALVLSNSLSTSGWMNVNAGGTLQVIPANSGTVTGGTMVVAGGSSSPGTIDMVNASLGTLSLGNLTVGTAGDVTGASQLKFDVLATNADLINLGSNVLTVNDGGAIITVSAGAISSGQTFTLMSFGSGAGNGFVQGSGLTVGGFTLSNSNLSFGVSGSLLVTGSQVQLVTSGASAPTTAYWSGAQGASWTANDGTHGNFTTDQAGTTPVAAFPAFNSDVIFAGDNATHLSDAVLGQDFFINSLTFQSTAAAANISGANALTIGSGGITVQAGNGGVTLGMASLNISGAQTWSNASSNPLTINAALKGTGSLTLNNGLVQLNGTGATFSGGVTVNSGTIQLGASNALGTGSLAFGAGSTGKLQLNGNNATVAGLTTDPTVGTPVVESGASTSGTDTLTVNTSTANTYAGLLQNGGTRLLALTKSGTGSLTLTNVNTYSGPTTINGGTLIVSAANNFGDGSATNTLIFGGGTLENTGGTYNLGVNRNITLTGAGTLQNDGGTLTVDGNVIGGSSSVLTIAGNGNVIISGTAGGSGSLMKTGTGTLTLTKNSAWAGSGASSGGFSGPLIAQAGTLLLSSGTHAVTGETVIGGLITNGGTGNNAKIQVDSGALNISGFLSIGRGNGIGTVSSDLVLNNAASVTAGNFSAGYNGGNIANLPKGSFTLNGSSSFTTGGQFTLAESAGSVMSMTLNNSSTVSLTGVGSTTNRGIGIVGSGTLTLNDSSTFTTGSSAFNVGYQNGTGELDINGGTFNSGGEIRVGASNSNGTFNGTGTITVNGGTLNTTALTLARNNNDVASTYTSSVLLYAGTVNVTGASTLVGWQGGAAAGYLYLAGGNFNQSTTTGSNNMDIGSFGSVTGKVFVSGGNLNMEKNSSMRFSPTTSSSGTNFLSISSGNVSFYSDGGTTVGGTGVIDLMNTAATANNSINLDGGTLTVNQIKASNATGTSALNLNGGTLIAASSTTSFVTGLTVANVRDNGAIIDTNGKNVTIGQALVHSTIGGDSATDGGLTKNGSGTLTVSAANTYNGATTINAGTLLVSGSLSATNSVSVASAGTLQANGLINHAATVNVAGTLRGSGTVGAISATVGGIVAPGTASTTAVLTGNGNITLGVDGTAHLSMKIGSTTAGTGYDQLSILGGSTLNLTNVNLDGSLLNGYKPTNLATWDGSGNMLSSGDTFYLVIGAGNSLTGQHFANATVGDPLANGFDTIVFGNQAFAIVYSANFNGGTGSTLTGGNDIALIAVPEPGTWAMLVGGLGMLVSLQRVRRRKH